MTELPRALHIFHLWRGPLQTKDEVPSHSRSFRVALQEGTERGENFSFFNQTQAVEMKCQMLCCCLDRFCVFDIINLTYTRYNKPRNTPVVHSSSLPPFSPHTAQSIPPHQTSFTLGWIFFSLPVKMLNSPWFAAQSTLWSSDDLAMLKKCKEAHLKREDK